MSTEIVEVETDFRNWKSFPSSIKLINKKRTTNPAYVWYIVTNGFNVTPKIDVSFKVNCKQTGHPDGYSGIIIEAFTVGEWKVIINQRVPDGKFDWINIDPDKETVIPDDAFILRVKLFAKGVVGDITWFDDLKIYQSNQVVYENKFSDWKPVGALAGAVIGGIAGVIYKPIGPILSPLLGLALGSGLGYGAGAVAMVKPGSCPVCGSEVADKPLGEDVTCPSCGFVSAWTR